MRYFIKVGSLTILFLAYSETFHTQPKFILMPNKEEDSEDTANKHSNGKILLNLHMNGVVPPRTSEHYSL